MLKVDSLRKGYGKIVALSGVSFEVPSGTCFGLLGPNGAGKSTAISIIAGIIDADSGKVTLDGQEIGPDRFDIKRRIGYVPQELALYEDLSADENLAFFGSLYGLEGARLRDRMSDVCEVAGLSDRRASAVRTFSGGMKRRLNIAAALLHDPDVLILDEPTVGVDPQSRNQIFETLEQLIGLRKTLLYTTHYMEEVERLCTEAAIVDHGKVIADGAVAELHGLVPTKQVVEIRLQTALSRELPATAGVLDWGIEDAVLSVQLEDLTRDLPVALKVLEATGAVVQSVKTSRPTLEEVFLHLTGRRLRD